MRVSLNKAFAPQLVVGGLPDSRLPILVALFVLAAGLLTVAVVQLRRQQQLARLRTEFVSGVSHELRTPLAQIRWFAELLHLGKLRTDDERERSAGIIDQEARRLTYLVENVLNFSRAEKGTNRVSPEPAEIDREIQESLDLFAPLARARGMTIRASLGINAMMRVDRNALRQILLNLLDNAAKYGPAGQTITVGSQIVGDRARIWVEDEGPGYPARRPRARLGAVRPAQPRRGIVHRRQRHRAVCRPRARVAPWRPHARGVVARRRRARRRRAAAHATGLVGVLTATVFSRSIAAPATPHSQLATSGGPMTYATMAEKRPSTTDSYAAQLPTPMARILIVEDNVNLAYGLRTGLEIEGYDVQVAENGETGLERARAWGPDLVMLDLMLPGMDGYRVLKTLREAGSDVPVLILTARGEEADKVLGFRLGADDYVTKPCGVLELLARVGALLRRSQTRRPTLARDGRDREVRHGRDQPVVAHGDEERQCPSA